MQGRWLALFVIAAAIPVGVEAGCGRRDVHLAPDESRTVAAFVEAGAPSPDRLWTSDDYQRFAQIARATSRVSARGLPRFDSAASGPLMARVVSAENFRPLHDKRLTAQDRMIQAVDLEHALMTLTATYLGPPYAAESLSRELAELMGFTLEAMVEKWVVANEHLGTLPAAAQPARAAALEEVGQLTSLFVQMAVRSLNEKRLYPPPEMRRLAASLEKTLPALLPYVGERAHAEVVSTLRRVAKENCDAQTSATLGRLLDKITYGPAVALPRAGNDDAAYARYQTRIQQLPADTTATAALAQLGLPYEKHTFAENESVAEEWVYPTGLRERTRLRFDIDTGKLQNVTKASFDEDASFIHDGSRLMSDWDATRLHRLRAIRVGMSASEVRAIARPLLELPESQTSGIPLLPGSNPTTAKGDWWIYTLGNLTLRVTMRLDRVVAVSEVVSGHIPGKLWTHPIPVTVR
jgi:hypothetical protein